MCYINVEVDWAFPLFPQWGFKWRLELWWRESEQLIGQRRRGSLLPLQLPIPRPQTVITLQTKTERSTNTSGEVAANDLNGLLVIFRWCHRTPLAGNLTLYSEVPLCLKPTSPKYHNCIFKTLLLASQKAGPYTVNISFWLLVLS